MHFTATTKTLTLDLDRRRRIWNRAWGIVPLGSPLLHTPHFAVRIDQSGHSATLIVGISKSPVRVEQPDGRQKIPDFAADSETIGVCNELVPIDVTSLVYDQQLSSRILSTSPFFSKTAAGRVSLDDENAKSEPGRHYYHRYSWYN